MTAHAATLTLVLLVIPVAWSAGVALIRRLARQDQPALSDLGEKLILAAMLLPVAAGLAVLLAPPVTGPLSQIPVVPSAVDDVVTVATQTFVHTAKAGPDLIGWGAQALLGLCAVGAVIALGRLAWTHTRLRRIVRAATPSGDGVFHSDAAVPAFAWSQRQIILPHSLRSLSPAQTALIIAHERAHQTRHDPLWFLTLSVIEALLWFNPFLARQGRACRLAAELACDALVVGHADQARKTYAQTLIAVLKLSHAMPLTCVPAAGEQAGYRARLGQIMKPSRSPNIAAWLAGSLLLIIPVAVAQYAFAQGTTPAPLAAIVPDHGLPGHVYDAPASAPGKTATVISDNASSFPANAPTFAIPVDGQIGLGFGIRKDPIEGMPVFHEGQDFIAPIGTPVKASAKGTVSFAGDRPGYGTTVEIDHDGGMKTRYAHLSTVNVAAGDTVTAGQLIGAVGSTGRSTGPHLHFEIWFDGRPQNPAPLLGLTPKP